jgi:hypothetical protein
MNIHVSIHAHPRYLIATDAAALLLVLLLLFTASRIRYLLSPLAFLLLGAGVLAGFAADVGWWFWKGIRAAEIADDVLILYRGRSLQPQTFTKPTVLRVQISRVRGSRKAHIRMLSGRRLRIAEHAFPREEFTRFLAALESWAPR